MSSNNVKTVYSPIPLTILNHWLCIHGQAPRERLDLPLKGFYVEIDNIPVAAGYLRKCEGNYGMIDSVVTNPTSKPEVRDQALNYLIEMLLTQAYKMSMKVVTAFTFDDHTVERAKRYGFEVLPHKTIVKSLMERF